MYEVKVRDIPARSLLCLLRHASSEQEVWDLGKEVIGMLKAQPPPRVRGGVPDLLRGGEPGQRRPGGVLLAGAAGPGRPGRRQFPPLTLRTEPAHQEAYSHLGQDPLTATQAQLVSDSVRAWAAERQPSDLPLRTSWLPPRQ